MSPQVVTVPDSRFSIFLMRATIRLGIQMWVRALLALLLLSCSTPPPPGMSAPSSSVTGVAPPSASPSVSPPSATATRPAPLTVTARPTSTPAATISSTPTQSPTLTPTAPPTDTPSPPTPTSVPPTQTPPPPSSTPLPPTVAPTPTTDPFAPWSIEHLRQRSYSAGPITIGALLFEADRYQRYAIRYPSDGLMITGILTRPRGDGPFPVLLLNHGYYDPAAYTPGDGTRDAAAYFAERGYLTIASDYRNYGGSDRAQNYFRLGFVVDVMALLNALPTLPEGWADRERVGLWGHSMGGAVTINVVALAGARVDAAVIYGGMSGDMAEATRHVLSMWQRPDFVEPVQRFGGPDDHPDAYARMSAINYLGPPQAALSIHHGTADEQVPYAWSETLRDRALNSGLQVEHFAYPDTRHNFAGDAWQRFMARCADFFAREL